MRRMIEKAVTIRLHVVSKGGSLKGAAARLFNLQLSPGTERAGIEFPIPGRHHEQ